MSLLNVDSFIDRVEEKTFYRCSLSKNHNLQKDVTIEKAFLYLDRKFIAV